MVKKDQSYSNDTINDTVRVEIFSDAVYAIVATLLILDLKVPIIKVTNSVNILHSLHNLLPELIAFIFSFFIIVIFWVNHFYFFQHLEKVDWRLIWYNNFHLFWIATIPFTTALIGKYHTATIPATIYALDLMMASISILLMAHYASFKANLLHPGYPKNILKQEFNRALIGPLLYAIAAILSLVKVQFAIVIFIITPILFFVPRIVSKQKKISYNS